MNPSLRSQQDINSSFQELYASYLHKRVNFKWFFKFITLKTEYEGDIWTYVLPSLAFIVLIPIFLYEENFRLNDLILTFTDFTALRAVELIAFVAFILLMAQNVIYFLSPLLLSLRKYKIDKIQFEEKNFTKGSKVKVIILFIIILLGLKLYKPLSSHLPFLDLFIGLLFLFSVILLLFFPSYLWNGMLHELSSNLVQRESVEENSNFFPYDLISNSIDSDLNVLINKKSFISKKQDIVGYFSGHTILDYGFYILFIVTLVVLQLLSGVLHLESKDLVNNYIIVIIIVVILFLLFDDRLDVLIKFFLFNRGTVKVNIEIYSQELVDFELRIPEYAYYENKKSKDYIEYSLTGYKYFERPIKFQLNKEYEIQVNKNSMKFIIGKTVLTSKSRRILPKDLKIILNIRENEVDPVFENEENNNIEQVESIQEKRLFLYDLKGSSTIKVDKNDELLYEIKLRHDFNFFLLFTVALISMLIFGFFGVIFFIGTFTRQDPVFAIVSLPFIIITLVIMSFWTKWPQYRITDNQHELQGVITHDFERKKLSSILGNSVWVLKDPQGIKLNKIYFSRFRGVLKRYEDEIPLDLEKVSSSSIVVKLVNGETINLNLLKGNPRTHESTKYEIISNKFITDLELVFLILAIKKIDRFTLGSDETAES